MSKEEIIHQHARRVARGLIVDEFDTPRNLEFLRGDKLKDKCYLIIGGTNGIGAATGILFALQGARVIVNYHANPRRVDYMKAQLDAAGADLSRFAFVKADITDQRQIYGLYERVKEEFDGGIDAIGLYAAGGAGKKNNTFAWRINHIAQLNLAELALEHEVFPETGGDLLWVTSNYALGYKGVAEPANPALTDYLTDYHPVARWKHRTGIELDRMESQLTINNVRLLTLSGPIVPHTSAIDVIQLRTPHLYPLLISYFNEASRLDMAAGALDLLTNPHFASGDVLFVTQNYSHHHFPR